LLRDPVLQNNLQRALGQTLERRRALVAAAPHWPLLRERARAIRDQGMNRQVELLEQLRFRIEAHGGSVHSCGDAAEARATVAGILHDAGARTVVKGKSMVTEEIELNHGLEAEGIEVTEGDLGELIVQLRGEAPTHLTAPALHLNRRQIARVLSRACGEELPAEPAALTRAARRYLRRRFLAADAGITGANFLVAESGSVVLVENEGNIRLAAARPLHIVVTGVDKVIPRLNDLAPLLELLPTSATGQKTTAAVSIFGGPRCSDEADGPEAFHLVLVDNGRRALLADPLLRAALRCIRCGACLNICPVFQRLGGHGFGSVYPGPIGVVLSRALLQQRDSAHAFACSLCGACDEICPVEVPLSQLILEVRRRCQLEAGPTLERLGHSAFAAVAARPRLFSLGCSSLRRLAQSMPSRLSTPLTAGWTDVRDLPGGQPRSRNRGGTS